MNDISDRHIKCITQIKLIVLGCLNKLSSVSYSDWPHILLNDQLQIEPRFELGPQNRGNIKQRCDGDNLLIFQNSQLGKVVKSSWYDPNFLD